MHGLDKALVNDLETAKLINRFDAAVKDRKDPEAREVAQEIWVDARVALHNPQLKLTDRDRAGLETIIHLYDFLRYGHNGSLPNYFDSLAHASVKAAFDETAAYYAEQYTKGIEKATKAFRKVAVA